jgi:hypothetical protein
MSMKLEEEGYFAFKITFFINKYIFLKILNF